MQPSPHASRRIAPAAGPPVGGTATDIEDGREARESRPRPPANVRMAPGEAPAVVAAGKPRPDRPREVAVMLLWTAGLFLAMALASFAGDPHSTVPAEMSTGSNWVGPVGETFARGLVSLFGIVSWMVPVELCLLGMPLVTGQKNEASTARLAGDLLLVFLFAALVQVAAPAHLSFGSYMTAGYVGELFGETARSLFSTAGSFLVGIACIGLVLVGRASFSFIALARLFARILGATVRGGIASVIAVREAWRAAREIERQRNGDASPPIVHGLDLDSKEAEVITDCLPASDPAMVASPPEDEAAPPTTSPAAGPVITRTTEPAPEEAQEVATDPPPARARRSRARKTPTIVDTSAALEKEVLAKEEEPEAEAEGVGAPPDEEVAAIVAAETADDEEWKEEAAAAKKGRGRVRAAVKMEAEKVTVIPTSRHAFQLPSYDLLTPAKLDPSMTVDGAKLLENAETLVQTLAHYGVSGKVEEILPGPTVTTYEVSPAPGTKVSKVASLADDLALALAIKVRIVAPIPGKNRIGFELPNEKRVPVSLRDLIEDRRFQSLDTPLPVVLGRDILGHPVYADLAAMPHVIVAGATGAGKSVGLNVMLTSLLYRRTPDELRLLMIDPKVVELAPFDRIPHMLLPVVTDMKQASVALKWAVDEMERRYQLFADAGTKNISTFNGWVTRVRNGDIKNPAPKMVLAKDHNGLPEVLHAAEGEEGVAPLPEKLPFIVVVVDEFADLMMQQGKEVEASVARLAQKARAAGMHVILATQRPSVDVITGMIKANFPTRIAYRVAQKVDSRTILDEQGAEHLLGRGDMLIKLNGTNDTKRVQCPMVSEEEVQAVTDHLRAQGEPVYDENILKPRDDEGAEAAEDAEQDPLYDDAVRIVADTRRCSTSWLQRKLGLGYNRAARIVEMMERRGLVGPTNGAKEREVLIGSL